MNHDTKIRSQHWVLENVEKLFLNFIYSKRVALRSQVALRTLFGTVFIEAAQ